MNSAAVRKVLVVYLPAVLITVTSDCATRNVPAPKPPLPPSVFKPLQAALLESYGDLFQEAPRLEFSTSQLQRMREYLDQAEKHRTGRFENRAKELDDKLTYVEAGEWAEMRLTQLELREAQVEERRAEANVQKMVARAPIDGFVVMMEIFRNSEFGQIQVGDQIRSGRPYMQIVDPRSIIIEAHANQADVEHLRIGAQAYVHFDAYSNLELPARVYSIGPLAISRGWRADYVSDVPVFLKLDRMDSRLITNLSVSADVILHREWGQEIIPREAVFQDAEDGQPFAYIRTSTGWEKRELELGTANYVDIAVRSGLRSGEVVAVDEPSA